MKKVVVLWVLAHFAVMGYGQLIIADHTVVDDYDKIPQQWINEVKKMWVVTAGASHAEAYRMGCWKLMQENSYYTMNTDWQGEPMPYTNTALRINKSTWGNYDNATGWQYTNVMKDWWTNDLAKSRVKAGLQYCKNNGPALYAILYGWSYDGVYNSPTGGYDPVYNTRWGGRTEGGVDGATVWGLDAGDVSQTSNSVTMNNYIVAMNEYMTYCTANNIGTKIIWSTGPVENESANNPFAMGESGYQQSLKWKYIKDYCIAQNKGYLMDYADILSHSDAGVPTTTTWVDNKGITKTFPFVSPENMTGDAIGHIGYVGALKLGKAMWWLLARMAGWDGVITSTSYSIDTEVKEMKIIQNGDLIKTLFSSDLSGDVVCLQSLSGQVIDKQAVSGDSCELNVASLPKGVYFISLASGCYPSEKFIKL